MNSRLAKLLLLCSAVLLVSLSTPAFSVPIGSDAPSFNLPSNKNTEVKLTDFAGKVVLVDFWASWCAACSDSLKWLDGLQKKFGPSGFQVIAVNLDEENSEADEVLSSTEVDLLVGYDPEGETPEHYQVQAMPSAYLIGKDGKLISAHRGGKHSEKLKIEEKLQSLLP